MKNTRLNIDNLTSLWTLAGQNFEGFTEHVDYSLSAIENSEWPNKIWTNQALTPKSISAIKKNMDNLVFSFFNEQKEPNSLIKNADFKLKFCQYGMSLSLIKRFRTEKKLKFIRVHEETNAQLWSTSFSKAFGYSISIETILKTNEDIQYYLIYHQENLVGTIVLFITNKVAGIHCLGILPSQRKKGFATEIMHHVMNMIIDQDCNLAVLQASEMAKNIYLKMGFSIDFLMENYILKSNTNP